MLGQPVDNRVVVTVAAPAAARAGLMEEEHVAQVGVGMVEAAEGMEAMVMV